MYLLIGTLLLYFLSRELFEKMSYKQLLIMSYMNIVRGILETCIVMFYLYNAIFKTFTLIN